MGYFPKVGGTVVVQENDLSTTTRTGTTYTTHNTYVGLTTATTTMYRFTIFGSADGTFPRMKIIYGDGTNEDSSTNIRMWSITNTTTDFIAVFTITQDAAASTGQANLIIYGSGPIGVGNNVNSGTNGVNTTLTNVVSWDKITQIELEFQNSGAGNDTVINHVLIEKLTI